MENRRDDEGFRKEGFRKGLLKDGFMMLRYSISANYLPSEEPAEAHQTPIQEIIPPLRQVRLMTVTNLLRLSKFGAAKCT